MEGGGVATASGRRRRAACVAGRGEGESQGVCTYCTVQESVQFRYWHHMIRPLFSDQRPPRQTRHNWGHENIKVGFSASHRLTRVFQRLNKETQEHTYWRWLQSRCGASPTATRTALVSKIQSSRVHGHLWQLGPAVAAAARVYHLQRARCTNQQRRGIRRSR